MLRAIIQRAFTDTKATVQRHIPGTAVWLALSAIGSSAGYALFFNPAVMFEEWGMWAAGLGGTVLAATVFFLFNLCMAPYRLVRDRADAAEARIQTLEKNTAPVQRDWPISSLFSYLRPDIRRDDLLAWKDTLQRVEDAFSAARLSVWGRRQLPHGRSGSLERIEADYWKDADLTGWCVDPRSQEGRHTDLRFASANGGWRYSDLHVDEAAAKQMWSHPLAAARVIEGDTPVVEAAIYVDSGRWFVRPGDPADTVMPGIQSALSTIQEALKDGSLQCWACSGPVETGQVAVPATYWINGFLRLDILLNEYPHTCRHDASAGESLYFPKVSSLEIEALRDRVVAQSREFDSIRTE